MTDLNYRFIWQPHIKKLLLNEKEILKNPKFENRLLNNVFSGYPKEFILKILN